MEALFHLVFVLIKIAILAGIYTMMLLFIFRQVNKSNTESWFQKITSNKRKFRLTSGAIISIILFIWMFTYWGNHGFGDFARIPIGNGYVVKNINWTEYGYIDQLKTSDGKEIEMTEFIVKNRKLIGNLDSWFEIFNNKYFAFDLKTEKLIEFDSKSELDEFAKRNNLPTSEELKSFKENYQEHWNGWRFWLLP